MLVAVELLCSMEGPMWVYVYILVRAYVYTSVHTYILVCVYVLTMVYTSILVRVYV